jgi:hypothetical protein
VAVARRILHHLTEAAVEVEEDEEEEEETEVAAEEEAVATKTEEITEKKVAMNTNQETKTVVVAGTKEATNKEVKTEVDVEAKTEDVEEETVEAIRTEKEEVEVATKAEAVVADLATNLPSHLSLSLRTQKKPRLKSVISPLTSSRCPLERMLLKFSSIPSVSKIVMKKISRTLLHQ